MSTPPDSPSGSTSSTTGSTTGSGAAPRGDARLPIRMLHDRVLVSLDREAGERRSGAGILIPATATVGKRLSWGEVAAAGQHVRQVRIGDRVLFDPEERAEVELSGREYVLLRERDLHAVAAPRVEAGSTGLYL